MKRRFAMLREGDGIELRAEQAVVGFYVDRSLTNGFLALEGRQVTLRKPLLFDDSDVRMELRFVPMRAPHLATRVACCRPGHNYERFTYSRRASSEDIVPVVSLQGIACWSGGSHDDLPIRRRGAITCRPSSRMPVQATDDLEIQAPDLPIGRGWHPHHLRYDSRWSRSTGPETPSFLAFEFEPGRYCVELHVLGAVTGDALRTLQASAGNKWLDIARTFDKAAGFYRCSMALEVEKAGPLDLALTVPAMRNGAGIELTSMRITGDRRPDGAPKD